MPKGSAASVGEESFFPPDPAGGNVLFARWHTAWGALACAFHNAFEDIFAPQAKPQQKDSYRLFPAMVLFRHSIELLLKGIRQKVCKEKPRMIHKLPDLFADIQDNADVCHALGPDNAFVRQSLGELQRVDPNGYGFRYGIGTRGEVFFEKMPELVDAKRLYEKCQRLWATLWKVHGPYAEGELRRRR